ncbi:MAG: GNAT family N-acetyltransferase [Thermoleophilaceae bacterium]
MTEPYEAGDAELVELEPGDPRLGEALEVMRALRCNRSLAELQRLLDEGRRRGEYRVAALFDGGECRAVAGFRVLTSFAHGRYLYVDDLVTGERWRSRGYGERLEGHLRAVAREEGCEAIRLDSGVARRRAHRFYFRRGYAIESFNFGRRLDDEDGR